MNIRLTPEDILAFYKQYGKLPDSHLFAPEDLKEFFTLLHLENQHPNLSLKSKNAIWKKTQQSLNLPKQSFLNFGNFLKVGFAALVTGTGLFFVSTYINNQNIQSDQIALNTTNSAINSLLYELDTSYIDENSPSLENRGEENSSKKFDNPTKTPSFFENLIQKGKTTSSKPSEFVLNPSSTYFTPSDSTNNPNHSNNLDSSKNANTHTSSEAIPHPLEPSEELSTQDITNNNNSSETEVSRINTSIPNSGDTLPSTSNTSQSKEEVTNTKESIEDISEKNSTFPSDSTNLASDQSTTTAEISRQSGIQTTENLSNVDQSTNTLDSLSKIAQLKQSVTEDNILEEIQNNLIYLKSLTF